MSGPTGTRGRYRPRHVLERVGKTLKGVPLFSDTRPISRRRLLSRKRLLLGAAGLATVVVIGAVLGPGAVHSGPTKVVTDGGATPSSARDAVRSALPGESVAPSGGALPGTGAAGFGASASRTTNKHGKATAGAEGVGQNVMLSNGNGQSGTSALTSGLGAAASANHTGTQVPSKLPSALRSPIAFACPIALVAECSLLPTQGAAPAAVPPGQAKKATPKAPAAKTTAEPPASPKAKATTSPSPSPTPPVLTPTATPITPTATVAPAPGHGNGNGNGQ